MSIYICIAIISSNILVAKVMGGYFACFMWPQRQGSIGKHGIYGAEQGMYIREIDSANSQSYFSIHLVYSLTGS